MGKRIRSIPKGAMKALQQHHWPGNVRELKNIIEHAVLVADGRTIEVDDLPLGLCQVVENGIGHAKGRLHGGEDAPEAAPISLVRAMGDPEIRQGLGIALELTRTLAEIRPQPNH